MMAAMAGKPKKLGYTVETCAEVHACSSAAIARSVAVASESLGTMSPNLQTCGAAVGGPLAKAESARQLLESVFTR